MNSEEQVPPTILLPSNNAGLVFKFLAIVIMVFYLVFLFTIVTLHSTFIPQMEEAGEETEELILEAGAGGAVQVIRHDMAQKVRAAYIISLISFGILDGTFALILWLRRVKRGHEVALLSLTAIQIINRLFSGFVIVQLSIPVFVSANPRALMNALYLVLIISSVLSFVLILVVYLKLLESKTVRVAYKVRQKATG